MPIVIDEEEDLQEPGYEAMPDDYEPIPRGAVPTVLAEGPGEALLPPAQPTQPDPGPLPGAPLLPPAQVPQPLKPLAGEMATNWPRFYGKLTPSQRAAVDLATNNPDDMEGEKKRFISQRWVAEKNGRTNQAVADNWETARAAHAKLNAWGDDIGADDAKFFGKVETQAKAEKLEGEKIYGQKAEDIPPLRYAEGGYNAWGKYIEPIEREDTETLRKSREDSLVNRAYYSGAEETATPKAGGLFDAIGDFFKFEKDNRKDLIPGNVGARFQLFMQMYGKGNTDRMAANEAAAQAFPILARSGDVGGVDPDAALDFFMPLTPDQRRLAVDQLNEMAKNPKFGGGQQGVETQGDIAQLVTAAGRGQQNLLEDAFSEQRRMAFGMAAAAAHKEFKPDDTREALAKELRTYSQNSLNGLRRDSIPQVLAQTFAESLPIMAYTATPFGAPVRLLAYTNNARSDLITQGYSPDAASAMAPFIAAGQAGADQLTFGAAVKNPVVASFINKWSSATLVGRTATRLLGHTASATAAVEVRNYLVAGYVKDFAHVMDSQIPGENWEAVGKQMADTLPETMVNMMALAAFGVGRAAAKDYNGAGIDRIARDPHALAGLGFRPEQIDAVVAASRDRAGIVFKEEFAKRQPFKEGDTRTLTPAQAAEFIGKAQQAVAPDAGPSLASENEGVTTDRQQASSFLNDVLREQFPDATPEELAGIESQVHPDFMAHHEEQNQLAGVRDIFRDENGWHLEMENGEVRDAGDVDTALEMRDTMAAGAHEAEAAKAEKEKPDAEKVSELVTDEEFDAAVKALTEQPETKAPNEEKAPTPVEAPQSGSGESAQREATGPPPNEGTQEAPPSPEPIKDAREGTNISNAEMDRQAKEAGVEPSPGMPKWQAEALRKKTLETVAAKPDAAKDLVQELKGSKRAITPEETFLLGNEKIRLSKLADEALAKRDNEKLPQGERDAAASELKDLERKQQELRDVSKSAGSIAGSQLGARQFLFTNDFSLSDLRANWRDELNDGKPLNKKQEATIKALHEDLAATKKALEEKDASMVKAAIEAYAAQEKQKAKAAQKGKVTKSKEYFQKLQEEGAKQFRDAMGKSGAGFSWADPAAVAGAVKVVAGLIGEGITKVAEIAVRLAEKLGEAFGREDIERLMALSRETVGELTDFRSEFHEKSGIKDIRIGDTTIVTSIKMQEGGVREVEVSSVRTKTAETGKGNARRAMREFLKSTDREGLDISLLASPLNKSTKLGKLVAFYESLGFKKTGRTNSVGEPYMERIAQGGASLIEKSRAIKEDALAKIHEMTVSGKSGSGIEKIAELTYHAARFAVGAAGEYGLKGAELAAHVIEKLGKWAKDHITAIMDLAEAMQSEGKGEDIVKEVGSQVAKAEDFQKRLQEIGDAAAKEASDDLIKEVGKDVAKGEAFQARLEKQAKAASDAAKKKASDDLIKEIGAEVARDEDFQKKLKAQADKVDSDAARHLENLKKAVARRTAGVEEKTAKGDFATPPKKEPVRDKELDKLKAAHAAAILKYERAKEQERLNKRTLPEKIVDTVAAWKRTAVLMSATVYGKLSTAAAELFLFTPLEDLAGGALSKVPGLSKVAEKAPRHGGIDFGAQANAVVNTWKHLFEDAKSILKTGKTEIDLLHGKEKVFVDKGFAAFIGRTHYLLKSPAKRAEFIRSFETRVNHYAEQGRDISEPLWQARIAEEAYADANRGIFMEDNAFTKAWGNVMLSLKQRMEEKKKAGDYGAALGLKLVEGLLKFELPIVRIPTNIVMRTFEYLFGLGTGTARLAAHIYKGLDAMSPEQADIVMRNLKRGSLGAALFAIGFLNPGAVGGYYQQGRRPDEDEPDFGELRINGWNVPKWAIHNPLLEALQFGATVRHVMDTRVKKSKPETKPLREGVTQAMGGLAEEIPFVSGVKRTIDAAYGHDKRSFIGEELKSMIPSAVGQLARATDKDAKGEPVKRRPETIVETLESAVPGLRQKVPTDKDRKRGK